MATVITVSATVNAPMEKVWKAWTTPEDIMQWNNAADTWHTPAATNDFRPEGKFSYTMAAKDGSFSFDFWGTYDEIIPNELIKYTIGDGRKVEIIFKANGNTTDITENFEAEGTNSLEMRQGGWQAILNNFKKHAEAI